MIAFLNHPNFGWGVRAEDMLLAEELRYFEVFNGHPGVRNYGDDAARLAPSGCGTSCWPCGSASTPAGRVRRWRPTTPTATTSGASGKVNPGRGWVMVRAPHLTAEALVRGDRGRRLLRSAPGSCWTRCARDGDELPAGDPRRTGRDVQDAVHRHDEGRQPRLDAEARQGRQAAAGDRRCTRRTSARWWRSRPTPRPSYKLTGKELYVRAKVTSQQAAPEPVREGRRGSGVDAAGGAVTPPVGREGAVSPRSSPQHQLH